MGTPDESLYLPSLVLSPRFGSPLAPSLFPVTGSQVLSHLSLFHFLQHCAILNGCQISTIPFQNLFHIPCELKEPRKHSIPLLLVTEWVYDPGLATHDVYGKQTAKVTSHDPSSLVPMPLGGPFSLSVVGPVTCF